MPRHNPLAGADLLALEPVRLAEWEERDVRVVLTRPKPRGSGVRWLAERLSTLTGVPRIRLDELGSFVWRRLDGRPVWEVCEAVRAELGERAEPVEPRLAQFLAMLRKEKLIGYRGYDE
jgi:hypothetical protein